MPKSQYTNKFFEKNTVFKAEWEEAKAASETEEAKNRRPEMKVLLGLAWKSSAITSSEPLLDWIKNNAPSSVNEASSCVLVPVS